MFFILIFQKFPIVGATIFMPVEGDYKSRANGIITGPCHMPTMWLWEKSLKL